MKKGWKYEIKLFRFVTIVSVFSNGKIVSRDSNCSGCIHPRFATAKWSFFRFNIVLQTVIWSMCQLVCNTIRSLTKISPALTCQDSLVRRKCRKGAGVGVRGKERGQKKKVFQERAFLLLWKTLAIKWLTEGPAFAKFSEFFFLKTQPWMDLAEKWWNSSLFIWTILSFSHI